jgi:hypothetical protein
MDEHRETPNSSFFSDQTFRFIAYQILPQTLLWTHLLTLRLLMVLTVQIKVQFTCTERIPNGLSQTNQLLLSPHQ